MNDLFTQGKSYKKRRPRSWHMRLWIVAGIVLALGLSGCQSRDQPTASPTPVVVAQTAASNALQATAWPAPVQPATIASPTAATPLPAASPTLVPSATTSAAMATPHVAPDVTPTAAATPAPADLPVRIVIDLPGGKLDAPVVEMGWKVVQTASGPRSDWEIPKNEAGRHLNSTALGEQGNLVISGHNNIYGQVFRLISLAWNNDQRTRVDAFTDQSPILNGREIQLFDASGQRFDYAITAFYRLKDTGIPLEQRIANARFMQPTDETQLTLITCWPPSSNTHRLVVVAKPVQ